MNLFRCSVFCIDSTYAQFSLLIFLREIDNPGDELISQPLTMSWDAYFLLDGLNRRQMASFFEKQDE
jgi:hypothetical protein